MDIRRSEKHSFDFDSDLSLAKRSSVWHCELDAKNETDNLASFKLPYPNPGAKSHDNSFLRARNKLFVTQFKISEKG